LRNHLLPTLSIGPKSDFATMELGHFLGIDHDGDIATGRLLPRLGPGGRRGRQDISTDNLRQVDDEGAPPDQKISSPAIRYFWKPPRQN
jgi:hypothetical protein